MAGHESKEDWYKHSQEEKALIEKLHTLVPKDYRIPAYASMWWLKGVTLYLDDARLPSAAQLRNHVDSSSSGGSGSKPAAAAAGAPVSSATSASSEGQSPSSQ